jgi:hypothetical protein
LPYGLFCCQAAVIKLLGNKAKPSLFGGRRFTALEAAAKNNDLTTIRLLLKRGAGANLGYPSSYTKDCVSSESV